jgi:hypothetical protein
MTPTREEVDKAHARGHWLDIGAMSMKNVFAISRKRLFLWVLLGISSPFLQFLYAKTQRQRGDIYANCPQVTTRYYS